MPLAENCILHTDQGFQYTERKYCDMLKRRGIVQSMLEGETVGIMCE